MPSPQVPRRGFTCSGPPLPSLSPHPRSLLTPPHPPSSEPLPASLQYLYRHPVNVHPSFLDISGDFLRRRFDSIDAASRWIDEMDALRRHTDVTVAPATEEDLASRLAEALSLSAKPSPSVVRAERRRDPVWRGMPESMWAGRSDVLEGTRGSGAGTRGFRIGKRHGAVVLAAPGPAYSRSHTGAARRTDVGGVLQRRHSEADVCVAAAAAVGLGAGCLRPEEPQVVMMED